MRVSNVVSRLWAITLFASVFCIVNALCDEHVLGYGKDESHRLALKLVRTPPRTLPDGGEDMAVDSGIFAFGDDIPHDVYSVNSDLSLDEFDRYALVGSGNGVPSQPLLRREDLVVVVFDDNGSRFVSIRRNGVLDDSESIAAMRSTSRTRWRFHVVGSDSSPIDSVMISDLHGIPWGLVEPEEEVELPNGFEGYAVASGHTCDRLMFSPRSKSAMAFLRKRATAVGRCVGVRSVVGVMTVGDVAGLGGSRAPLTIPVAGDGTFRIGPVGAGRKLITFSGERSRLKGGMRQVVLEAGHQDLGDFVLESTYDLHLRIVGPVQEHVFVGIWGHARALPGGLVATRHRVPHERLTLGPYVNWPIDVHAWTGAGWLGCGPAAGLLPSDTDASTPLVVTLLPPGSIDVELTAGAFGIPEGSRIVVSPFRSIVGMVRLSPNLRDIPAERTRVVRVRNRMGGNVIISEVWPSRVVVSLVSSGGAVLANEHVQVEPGKRAGVRLQATRLARMDVRNDTGRAVRFALLREAEGVVMRGAIEAGGEKSFAVLAGRYYLRRLDGGGVARGDRRWIEVLEASVRSVVVR